MALCIEFSDTYIKMTSHFQCLFAHHVNSLLFLNLGLFAVKNILWFAWFMKRFISLSIFLSFAANAELCDVKSKRRALLKGSKCQVRLDQVHPTQFTVGYLAIEDKREKIESLANDGEKLEEYLAKKDAPAIIGPDKRFHIIDRHHTSSGLLGAEIEESRKLLTIKIIDDFSNRSFDSFYRYMKKNKYVYLYKKGVGPLNPTQLPRSLNEMIDDPFRSLAWAVREAGGFLKEDIPYLEFFWADFLRTKLHLNDSSMSSINQVLNKAIKIARSKEASHLPGRIGQIIEMFRRPK